jgi:hypothetical protein
VIHLRGCRDCTFEVPAQTVLAKLLLEGCTTCTLHLRGRLLTSHLEVWTCDDVAVHVGSPLGTVQADGCGALRLIYADATHLMAIVHADVDSLHVHIGNEHTNGIDVVAASAAQQQGEAPKPDVQFITRWVGTPPVLLTERVIRDAADYPTTARELLELRQGGCAPGVIDAATQAVRDPALEDALQEEMRVKRADQQREQGNDAFRTGDWATAAVKYTASLDAKRAAPVLRNRAAAFLKLGKPDAALADAVAALELEPGHVKARFRHGLALHALQRYAEAGASLSAALAAEPGNAQIRDALRMTEFALARERRKEA